MPLLGYWRRGAPAFQGWAFCQDDFPNTLRGSVGWGRKIGYIRG